MVAVVKYLLTLSAFVFLAGGLSAQSSCNLTVTATATGTSCSNLCDGSVTLTPSGGTAPYTLNAFDYNFPGTQLDATIFTANGQYSVSNNTLTATPNTAVFTDFDNAISTIKTFPFAGKVVGEASFYISQSTFGFWGFSDTTAIFNELQFPLSFYFNNGTLATYNNGYLTPVSNYSSNTWYDFKIEVSGTTVSYYIRRTGMATYTLITTQTTGVSVPSFKLSATYRNEYGNYGGFQSKNWRIGGNPPTTGLCAGTYSYTIYDAVGCYANATVTVGSGTGTNGLKLSGSVTPSSCVNAANGAIGLTASGGVAPYSYGLSQNFQGSTINTTIFDIRNGNFSQSADLREGVNTSANVGWDNSIATRQTFSDGGYLNYEGSFKFDPNADVAFGFAKNDTLKDLTAILLGFRFSSGNTFYTFTSNNSLQLAGTLTTGTWYDFKIEKTGYTVIFSYRATGAASYTQVRSINYTPNIVEYKFGVLNYSSYFSSAGGYNTKNWSILVTPKVSRLAPGSYSYTITDAAGCTATNIFNVAQATTSVSLSASLVNPSTYNGATGSVSITPTGGTAPYSYSFKDGFNDSIINVGFFTVRNGGFSETTDLRSAVVSTGTSWDNGIATNVTFADGGSLCFKGSFKFESGTSAAFGFASNSSVVNDLAQLAVGFRVNGTQLYGINARNASLSLGSVTAGTWYDLMVVKTGSSIKYQIKASTDANYTTLATATYGDNLTVFRGAMLVIAANGGLNTKDWSISNNPSLTNLAPGTYTYRVYDAFGCFADASVTVPATGSPLPAVTAPADVTTNTNAGVAYATNVSLGRPTFGSDTTGMGITISNNASAQYQVGSNIVTWTITNKWGASLTATQSVWVRDVEPPVLTAPAAVNVSTDLNKPTASNVSLGRGSATDNASAVTITNNAPAAFPIGTTTVTWTARDASGNTTTATQLVTVVDQQAPSIAAPANVTVNTDLNADYATNVQLGNPTVTDNSGVATISNDAPAQYPIGVTVVTWKAVDAAGNTSTTTQSVTVVDNQPPTIIAPANIVVSTDANVAYATGVALGIPTVNDNDDVSTYSNNAPARYVMGVNVVTWTVSDLSGNTSTATQTVTVVDRQAPTLIPPADINIAANAGTYATGVLLGTPTVTDNVPGQITITNSNAQLQYPLGTTVITWKATDAAGNTSTATQRVNVVDGGSPVFASIATSVNKCYSDNTSGVYQVPAVSATVAAGTVSYSYTITGATVRNGSGSNASGSFNAGLSIITWKALGSNGKFTTATTKVYVDRPITVSVPPVTVLSTGAVANSIYYGYDAASTLAFDANVTGGTAPYNYNWSGSSSNLNVTSAASSQNGKPNSSSVSSTVAGTYYTYVTVTDSVGCAASATVQVKVVDVRCGPHMEKVIVCNNTGSKTNPWVQVCVSQKSVKAFLDKGGFVGPCNISAYRGTASTEVVATASVKAFPNPNRGVFDIMFSNFKPGKIRVIVVDQFGRIVSQTATVISFQNETSTVDLAKNANGVYLVKVIAEDGNTQSMNVVIAR